MSETTATGSGPAMPPDDDRPFEAEAALAAVAEIAPAGRFQVSAAAGGAVLLDTASGRSWWLANTDRRPEWQPVAFVGDAPAAPV